MGKLFSFKKVLNALNMRRSVPLYQRTPAYFLYLVIPLMFGWHPFMAFIDLITPQRKQRNPRIEQEQQETQQTPQQQQEGETVGASEQETTPTKKRKRIRPEIDEDELLKPLITVDIVDHGKQSQPIPTPSQPHLETNLRRQISELRASGNRRKINQEPEKEQKLELTELPKSFASVESVQLFWAKMWPMVLFAYGYPLLRGIFRTHRISRQIVLNSLAVGTIVSTIMSVDWYRWATKTKIVRKVLRLDEFVENGTINSSVPGNSTPEEEKLYTKYITPTPLQRLTKLFIQSAVPTSVCIGSLYTPHLPFIFGPMIAWKASRHLFQLTEDNTIQKQYEQMQTKVFNGIMNKIKLKAQREQEMKEDKEKKLELEKQQQQQPKDKL